MQMILALFPGLFVRVGASTFVSPTVAWITSRWEKIPLRIRLRCNLKTIYHNHFGVAAIRPFHTAGSQDDDEAAKRRERTKPNKENNKKGFRVER